MSKILKSFGMTALLVALLAGTGMAGVTTTVTGNVVNSATINVLETSVAFSNFAMGENPKEVTDFLEVTTNYNIVLQAAETGATTNDGKMATAGEAATLTNALKVGVGKAAVSLGTGTLPSDPVTVSNTITAPKTADKMTGNFAQDIVPGDTVATGYTATITFTAATP